MKNVATLVCRPKSLHYLKTNRWGNKWADSSTFNWDRRDNTLKTAQRTINLVKCSVAAQVIDVPRYGNGLNIRDFIVRNSTHAHTQRRYDPIRRCHDHDNYVFEKKRSNQLQNYFVFLFFVYRWLPRYMIGRLYVRRWCWLSLPFLEVNENTS